jgi:hypothetical protein
VELQRASAHRELERLSWGERCRCEMLGIGQEANENSVFVLVVGR